MDQIFAKHYLPADFETRPSVTKPPHASDEYFLIEGASCIVRKDERGPFVETYIPGDQFIIKDNVPSFATGFVQITAMIFSPLYTEGEYNPEGYDDWGMGPGAKAYLYYDYREDEPKNAQNSMPSAQYLSASWPKKLCAVMRVTGSREEARGLFEQIRGREVTPSGPSLPLELKAIRQMAQEEMVADGKMPFGDDDLTASKPSEEEAPPPPPTDASDYIYGTHKSYWT